MANVSEKFGLRPYKTLGGHAWNNQQNEYPIASGESTAIFQGDLVVPTGAGNIERYDVSGGATVKPIGVFNGVFYTDPTTKKPTFSNYYQNKTKNQQEAVDNDILREQRPEMPINIDRQSRVTFGGGRKS